MMTTRKFGVVAVGAFALLFASVFAVEASEVKQAFNVDPRNIQPGDAVAGVRPVANGDTRVLVAPQPGGLKKVQATVPTPKGEIVVDLKFKDGGAYGSIVLPPGLTGDFAWHGVRKPLRPGMNEFPDPALNDVPRAATPLSNAGLVHSWDPAPNWWAKRHEQKLAEIASYGGKIDVVMLGDSITHNWEGARGPGSDFGGSQLAEFRKRYSVVCLGYGGDTTRSVLWRIENGELDGYEAKCVMLMIGTNNGSDAPENIAAGIQAILKAIALKQPKAKTLLVSVFPCGERPDAPSRVRNAKVNAIIKKFADGDKVRWCDFSERFLCPDGTISKTMMDDFLHPGPAGYDIWAESITPFFKDIVGK